MSKTSFNRAKAPHMTARKMTPERMQQEVDYRWAQNFTEGLLKKNLITEEEFDKLSALNRESFSPYLAELMP